MLTRHPASGPSLHQKKFIDDSSRSTPEMFHKTLLTGMFSWGSSCRPRGILPRPRPISGCPPLS